MADPIKGLPYREIRFDATGSLLADDGLKQAVAAGGIDDLSYSRMAGIAAQIRRGIGTTVCSACSPTC
jgi:hypothetical protein